VPAWRRTTVGVLLQGARRNLLAWATPTENLRFVQALARIRPSFFGNSFFSHRAR